MLPYPLIECAGVDAVREWAGLRELGMSQGFYPVVVGGVEDIERLKERLESDSLAPASIVATASKLAGDEVLAGLLEGDPEMFEDVPDGVWPASVNHQDFVSHTELGSGRPKAKVFIVKLPTTKPYEAFAYLKYGGWNSCPGVAEHVAIHRMWYERFGAEVVFATSDVIECRVGRPPSSNPDAMSLGREQFVYCPDIVVQGVQDIATLAASLKNHGVWYFWWD